ncbi:MAG: thioredoxin [Ruminococcus sp.]|nr:thioredoxin [Ruminococcus sp.]
MSVTVVTDDTFEAEVLRAEGTVLVDFWAPWCGPCMRLSPLVDEVSEERQDVKFCKVNVDDCPDVSAAMGIMSIPALIVFRNGEQAGLSIGAVPKEKILALLD